MKKRIGYTFIAVIVSVALLIAVGLALEIMGARQSPTLPVSTPTIASRSQAVNLPAIVLSGNKITQTLTGTAILLPSYAADCYEGVTVSDTQTVTLKIQHSPDDYSWLDLYSFDDATADTTTFTHASLYGSYMRGVATLGSDNPVTVSLLCVFR